MGIPIDRLKKLVRPLGALAGITGAAAIVNQRLRETSALPLDHLGGRRIPWRWRDRDIFVTELGSGPPLLLIHGIYAGASSYEFRKLAPLLAAHFRVIAFDFLGCGLSEMPDIEYTSDLFVEQIVDALPEFFDEPITLIGSSLGAAFAIRAASRLGERIARLVAICPSGLGGTLDYEAAGRQRAMTGILRAPLLGETLFNGIASRKYIGYFLRSRTYADPASVTPDVLEHYYAVTHQRGARYVPAAFIGGNLNCNVARDLPFVSAPILIVWGTQATQTNPLEHANEFVRLASDGTLLEITNAGLLPHEEQPEATAQGIEAFIRSAGTT